MNILISWSGEKSKAVATLLRDWLPSIVQMAKPWMSAADIRPGHQWSTELFNRLKNTNFGILCLTEQNLHAPWIQFEAGALSKSVGESKVIPYLIDVEPEVLIGSPLSHFQAVNADKDGTKALVKAIAESLGEHSPEAGVIDKLFQRTWPGLSKKIAQVKEQEADDAYASTLIGGRQTGVKTIIGFRINDSNPQWIGLGKNKNLYLPLLTKGTVLEITLELKDYDWYGEYFEICEVSYDPFTRVQWITLQVVLEFFDDLDNKAKEQVFGMLFEELKRVAEYYQRKGI
jgi:hypothetical protein